MSCVLIQLFVYENSMYKFFHILDLRVSCLVYSMLTIDWRASVASETLTGVTQLKIGDVCLFIYILCLDVCMSFCTLTLHIFVFAPRSTPSQTSLNRILRFSDHYPYHLRN